MDKPAEEGFPPASIAGKLDTWPAIALSHIEGSKEGEGTEASEVEGAEADSGNGSHLVVLATLKTTTTKSVNQLN